MTSVLKRCSVAIALRTRTRATARGTRPKHNNAISRLFFVSLPSSFSPFSPLSFSLLPSLLSPSLSFSLLLPPSLSLSLSPA